MRRRLDGRLRVGHKLDLILLRLGASVDPAGLGQERVVRGLGRHRDCRDESAKEL